MKSATKKSIPLLVVSLALLSAANAQSVSSVRTPPASAVINQPLAFKGAGGDNGVQARYRTGAAFPGGADYRGLLQSFTWNSDGRLAGVGYLLSDDQNKTEAYSLDVRQDFVLDVQQLAASGPPVVETTVAAVKLTLEPKIIKAGRYIYIKFDQPLELARGKTYGLNLRPVDGRTPANRLILAFSGFAKTGGHGVVSAKYPGVGTGAQYNKPGQIADGAPFPRGNYCLTFFATADDSKR
ncbi:MAG: hypothetical protein LBM92_00420 [Opitutaceae bacterium]|jgi:hypothetical protein|nr:hypothetical protein [Opitutaceae bacterium]